MEQSTLDPTTIQSLLTESQPSLIPESLITTLTVGFIVLNVLAILFFVFYVINLIRKWRVDTAILHMQKDVADIKERMAKPAEAPVAAPAQPNRIIAQSDSTASDQSADIS